MPFTIPHGYTLAGLNNRLINRSNTFIKSGDIQIEDFASTFLREHDEFLLKKHKNIDIVIEIIKKTHPYIHKWFEDRFPSSKEIYKGGYYFNKYIYELEISSINDKANYHIDNLNMSPYLKKKLNAINEKDIKEIYNNYYIYYNNLSSLKDKYQHVKDLLKNDDISLLISGAHHFNNATTLILQQITSSIPMEMCALSIEMFLKQILYSSGYSKKQLKDLSHNVKNIYRDVRNVINKEGFHTRYLEDIHYIDEISSGRISLHRYENEPIPKHKIWEGYVSALQTATDCLNIYTDIYKYDTTYDYDFYDILSKVAPIKIHTAPIECLIIESLIGFGGIATIKSISNDICMDIIDVKQIVTYLIKANKISCYDTDINDNSIIDIIVKIRRD